MKKKISKKWRFYKEEKNWMILFISLVFFCSLLYMLFSRSLRYIIWKRCLQQFFPIYDFFLFPFSKNVFIGGVIPSPAGWNSFKKSGIDFAGFGFSFQTCWTNSGLRKEKQKNSFWSRFIMKSLSVGVRSSFSDVNCLSKLLTSLRCFCSQAQQSAAVTSGHPSRTAGREEDGRWRGAKSDRERRGRQRKENIK